MDDEEDERKEGSVLEERNEAPHREVTSANNNAHVGCAVSCGGLHSCFERPKKSDPFEHDSNDDDDE